MNKNEIIDAVLACWDREGTVSGGVHVDRFVALCRVLPSYRDVVVEPVVPAADETSHPVPEPVAPVTVDELIKQGFEPAPAPVETPTEEVQPVVAEPVVEPVVTE
jgi:hypothetical protein